MKEQFLNLSGLTDLVTYMKLCIAQHKVIIPRASFSLFPETGDENNIYIDTSTNAIYRWNDTDKKFVLLAKPPRTIAISEGTNNGEITLKVDNIASNAKVHGLTSTAFTESNKFATAAQGAKADSAVQTITLSSGTKNGTIKIKVNNITTDNIEVAGLGSAAFSDIGIFAAKSHTHKKDEVGLGNVDNTADINKSVKYATSAGAVLWKNITDKPTLFPPQQHNHDSLYYRKNEVDSLLSGKSDTGHTHVQFIQEVKFSNGTYSDPLNGTAVAIKASGGIASDLIYEGGKTLADKYQAKGSYAAASHKQAYTSGECTTYNSDDNTMGVTPAAVKKAFGIFGPKAHTHKKSDITDFPTSLPASDVYGWAKASSKPTYAWSEIANKPSTFAPSSHTHPISNIDGLQDQLNGKLPHSTITTAVDWDTLTTTGIYHMYVNSTASHHAATSNHGTLFVDFSVGTPYQIYIPDATYTAYKRIYITSSKTWSSWTQLKFTDTVYTHPSYTAKSSGLYKITVDSTGHVSATTAVTKADITGLGIPGSDTNTWRGIQNNLTSDSTSESLSAAQGKVLKALVDSKAASSHTHTISNITNLQTTLDGKSNTNHTHDLNQMINTLTNGTSDPADTDYYIAQYAGGGSTTTTYHRRPHSALWNYIKSKANSVYQPKGSYAASSHTHDDRYYTESEINTKLASKSDTSHTHNYVVGSYTGNGGQQKPNYFGTNKVGFLMMNTTVNGDSNYKDWIIMDCYGGNDVGGSVALGVNRQKLAAYIMRSAAERSSWAESAELLHTLNYTSYTVTKTGSGASGTWGINITGASGSCTGNAATASNASKVNGHTVNSDVPSGAKFTDTNTWRPLGTTADTACAGNDNRLSNARPASDVYSWAKASSKPSYSWSEITSKPSTFTPASHTHAYIPLSGGTITGSIIRSSGGSWISARNNVAVRGTATTKDSWNPVVGQATPNGYWTIGNLASNDNLAFSYTSNTNYNAGKNSATTVYLPVQEGAIITSATIGSQSVKYATSAGSAGSVAWGNVSGKPSSYTPSSHTHDDRYYTETEINTKLGAKLGAVSANGYYGMTRPDGNTSDWIRTTTAGLIPYQSGGAGGGHCGLGTSSWYFSNAYIDTVNCVNASVSGHIDVGGYIQSSNLINTYFEYQSNRGSVDWRFGAATGTSDENFFGFYDAKTGKIPLALDGNFGNIYVGFNVGSYESPTAVGVYLGGQVAGNRAFIYNGDSYQGSIWIQTRLDGSWKWFSLGRACSTALSDIRLKGNIRDTEVEDATKVIESMKIRSFERKDSHKKYKIGFIADELEQLDPNLVDGGGEVDGHPYYKSVNNLQMLAYVVKGMQELNSKVTILEKENKRLKQKLNMCN